MTRNTIVNIDAIEGMKLLADESVNLILSDLPQGITRCDFDNPLPMTEMWEQFKRIIKPNGAIVLMSNGKYTIDLISANKEMYKYMLIWEKAHPVGFLNARRQPMRAHEDICVFYEKQPTYNPQKTTGHPRKVSKAEHKRNCKESPNYNKAGLVSYDSTERFPRSVLKFASVAQRDRLHPQQKPVELFEWIIKTYTNEGDLAVDVTAGSGTTAEACINTSRDYICFEKDASICEIAVQRIKKGEVSKR